MSKETQSLTHLERRFLENLNRFSSSQKRTYSIYLEILSGESKPAANDSIFNLQVIKKNRLNTLQNLPIGNKPLDKIEFSNVYSEITNDPVCLFNGTTPQRYNALKSRLNGVIKR